MELDHILSLMLRSINHHFDSLIKENIKKAEMLLNNNFSVVLTHLGTKHAR